MTFAWYGHLKNLGSKPLIVAVLASWGIAFFEYLLQVPANRIGFGKLTLPQLKMLQEVITLSVFVPFSMFYMRQPMRLDFLVGRAVPVRGGVLHVPRRAGCGMKCCTHSSEAQIDDCIRSCAQNVVSTLTEACSLRSHSAFSASTISSDFVPRAGPRRRQCSFVEFVKTIVFAPSARSRSMLVGRIFDVQIGADGRLFLHEAQVPIGDIVPVEPLDRLAHRDLVEVFDEQPMRDDANSHARFR